MGFEEYRAFLSEMLVSMGRAKLQSSLHLNYFQRADNDSSGKSKKKNSEKNSKSKNL